MTTGDEPRLGDRRLFPTLEARAYCNHAAISPPSTPVTRAVERVLADYARHGLAAFFPWQERREGLRRKCARLIGAAADDVALTSGTTRGISDIAHSIPWQPGDRVVLFEGEFPANVTPWQRVAERFELEIGFERADDFAGDAGLEKLETTLAGGVRLVAVSAVQFQTGLAMPLEPIGALCRRYGAELCVDAIQGLGVVPLDVERCHVDYLSTGAHKWLMGVEGAGFSYVRGECARRLNASVAGWLSHEDAVSFLMQGSGHLRYDRPLKKDARVFEGGAPNVLGLSALEPAVDLLLELGIERVFAHVQRYHDALEPALVERGFRSLRLPSRHGRSGSLCLEVPDGVDLLSLHQGLLQAGIACSIPDGRLRFSPHWPNSLQEVDAIVQRVRELV